ncbi:MAG: hypothetical protein ACE5IJ_00775 [Thermoplasmata archaeon]
MQLSEYADTLTAEPFACRQAVDHIGAPAEKYFARLPNQVQR